MRCWVGFGIGCCGYEGSAGLRRLACAPGRVAQTERSGERASMVALPQPAANGSLCGGRSRTGSSGWLRKRSEAKCGACSGFFSAEQRFPTEQLAGAVERFVCCSGGWLEGSKCRAVPGAAFAGDRSELGGRGEVGSGCAGLCRLGLGVGQGAQTERSGVRRLYGWRLLVIC